MIVPTDRFRNFAARVLEHEGALVEAFEPEGLEAMLPLELQRHLRAPEMLRLGFGAETPPDAQRVSLESDWLERLGGMLDARGKQLRFVADVLLPELTAPERVLEHGIELPNAVYRFLGVTPAFTRYWLFVFRYTAISDEKREGLIRLGVNTANGSALDAFVNELWHAVVVDDLPAAMDEPFDSQLPLPWDATTQHAWLKRALPERVRMQLQQFLHGMQRRLERDLARVLEYYNGLRQEAFRKMKRANADSAREQLRLDAAEREYQAKVGDLKQKYDLRVTLELTQTLELICPVQRLELLVKRRKGERKVTLDWNPLVRALEPLPCEWSATAEGARLICDDKLHCVSVAGHAPCDSCGKEYCRACSPSRCPKCGK
jgi:hypothetical protein